MWVVISIMKDRKPSYAVENTETKERRNCDFEWEKHAQIFADYLNEKEKKCKH